MRDIVSGGIFLGFSIFFLINSQAIENPGYDILGPAYLPKMILWLMLVLSAGLILQAYFRLGKGELSSEDEVEIKENFEKGAFLRSGGVIALLAIFILSINRGVALFEILASVFMIVTGMLLVSPSLNIRNSAVIVVVSVIAAFVIGYVFKSFLHINLP